MPTGGRALQEMRGTAKKQVPIQVYVPYPLRELTRGVAAVDLEAGDLANAIEELNRRFPGFAYRVLDDQGRLRRYVNAFVNEEPVSHLDPADVTFHAGDVVTILPSVAGG